MLAVFRLFFTVVLQNMIGMIAAGKITVSTYDTYLVSEPLLGWWISLMWSLWEYSRLFRGASIQRKLRPYLQ